MDLRGKKLLVLGGTRLSGEIIKQARQQGVCVLVTDYLEDSPGKKIADKSFMVSTTDVGAVVKLLKEEQIDGMITGFIDSMLPYYQEICEKAGIPCYGTKKQFELATNKIQFKELCQAFDIPTVKGYRLPYPFDLHSLTQLSYPVLTKPADNSGGRGIYICKDADELLINLEKSLLFSPRKKVLVEEYMDCKEATAFYIIQDGVVCLSSMADRHVKKVQEDTIPLPVAYTFPSKHLKRYQETLDPIVVKMFESIGMRNGVVFIQMFVGDDKFTFYEMGYRLTGSLEYKIISALNGIDPLQMMIHFALTGSMHDKPIKPLLNPNYKEWGCNLTFLSKPGTIGKIIGINRIKALKAVIDVVPAYDEGDTIPLSARGTLKQVILRVFASAENREKLVDIMDEINRSFQVFSEDGENMLLDGFDTKEFLNIS